MASRAEQVADIAAELREQWIWTVLAVSASEPQRRSFIAGYNGAPMPSERPSPQMTRYYARGQVVSTTLHPERDHGK